MGGFQALRVGRGRLRVLGRFGVGLAVLAGIGFIGDPGSFFGVLGSLGMVGSEVR